MRPAIGITAAKVDATWGVWSQEAALLGLAYVAAVQNAGAQAIMIPPDPILTDEPDEILERLDGLMISGGNDVEPSLYGAERHPQTQRTYPERDATEIALVRRAAELDLPVLGICRGMQVINVAFGGTLIQHLPEHFGHEEHRRTPGSFDGSDHDVLLVEGSLAARAAGELLHPTKSHHHQGVERLGEGLLITGRSAMDDLPEAIEAPDRRFLLGVQWHPEADESSRVIHALVSAAEEYRTAQAADQRIVAGSA